MSSHNFGKPPPGYVAGIGRGAVGFTTRSDIGPSGANVPGPNGPPPRDADLSESQYDKFSGYAGSLFDASTPYEADDREADNIYDAIDLRMDSRRRERREKRLREEQEKEKRNKPQIRNMFSDLKRQLGTISTSEWENLPETGDISQSNKRVKKHADQFTPLPDSILDSTRKNINAIGHVINDSDGVAAGDLTRVGRVRDRALGVNLDRVSDSVSGLSVVDAKGYLTDLNSVKLSSEAELSDIKRARLLLKNLVSTNSKHAPGWIGAARLEEVAGDLSAAREVILRGCDNCPENEDLWLEAARLHPPSDAAKILAQAVKNVPRSVKLWMHAAELESKGKNGTSKKRIVLRRALEEIPNSVTLWKEAIQLEQPEEAKLLLRKAVECVPQATDMYLALARLESYPAAKKVLNRAISVIKKDISIWIAAAQLEEANDSFKHIETMIRKAVRSLAQQNVVIDRDQWLKEAEKCEADGFNRVCHAIVNTTLEIGVEEQDRKLIWAGDARALAKKGSLETAKAVYAKLLKEFPGKKEFWLEAAALEKTTGTAESLEALLLSAVRNCPGAEELWLMAAREKLSSGDHDTARTVLETAFKSNPNSGKIWLAAVDVELDVKEYDNARDLLKRAREGSDSARVWMKSALFERELGEDAAERELLEDALEKYPKSDKLWVMLGQNFLRQGHVEKAKEAFARGREECPRSVRLWLCSFEVEKGQGRIPQARSLLETARLKCPREPLLLLASVKLEIEAGNEQFAAKLISVAQSECPSSGLIWAYIIESEPKVTRKAKIVQALRHVSEDAYVFLAVAKFFAGDRRLKKAKDWFERALSANTEIGDVWAYYVKFLEEYNETAALESVKKRFETSNPKYGDVWISVAKAVGNRHLDKHEILQRAVELISSK